MKNIAFDLYGTLVDIHTDESAPHFIQNINRFVKERFDVADFFVSIMRSVKNFPQMMRMNPTFFACSCKFSGVRPTLRSWQHNSAISLAINCKYIAA